jgi:outer membrane receptor for ferric coprogen and ferric-rhodotorulic acid
MRNFARGAAAASVLALASAIAAPASAQDGQGQAAQDEEIVVYGLPIAEDTPQSATGLALTLRETPQSITVIDSQRITEFAMANTAQVLEQVVGLNVDRGESARTVFNARGFDVTNVQVDGIGIPLLGGIQYGETDSYLFERIEVIRGANGLTTGVGNPSATINYIRKRPGKARKLMLGAYAGSYDYWRVEADGNVPLTEDGGIALRLIGAHEQRKSHLFNYDLKRNLFAATLAAEISPQLTATVGYTYQHHKTHGSGWGSVTHFYDDGGRIDYDRSINYAPDWTYWPVMDEQAYAELAYSPSAKWTIKGVVTYKRFIEDPTLLYIYGNPNRATGLGLAGQASDFKSDTKRYLADLYATGRFDLFGREHQLTFGVSWTQSDWLQWQANALNNPQIIPNFRNLDNVHVPQPVFGPTILQLDQRETQKRAYVATQLNFADWLKAVVGTS